MGMLLHFPTVCLKLSENCLKISYLFRILGTVSHLDFFKKYFIITVYKDNLHKNFIQNRSSFEVKYIKIKFVKAPMTMEILFQNIRICLS